MVAHRPDEGPRISFFDQVSAPEGGRFDLNRLPRPAAAEYRAWRKQCRAFAARFLAGVPAKRRTLGAIELDFVDSSSLNAFAAQEGRKAAVGISIGVAHELQQIFKRMLRDRDLRMVFYDSAPSGETRDPPDLFAFRLSLAALLFIYLHELGHIVHGHVGWLKQTANLNMMSESRPILVASALEAQAFEYLADNFAVVNLTHVMVGKTGRRERVKGRYVLSEKSYWGVPIEAVIAQSFVMYVAFRFLGRMSLKSKIDDKATHPPLVLRQAYNCTVFWGTLEDRFAGTDEPLIEASTHTVYLAEQVWSRIRRTRQMPPFSEAIMKQGSQLLAIYNDALRRLHPALVSLV